MMRRPVRFGIVGIGIAGLASVAVASSAVAASAAPLASTKTQFTVLRRAQTFEAGKWTALEWNGQQLVSPQSPIHINSEGEVVLTLSATLSAPVRVKVYLDGLMRPTVVTSGARNLSFVFGGRAPAAQCGHGVRVMVMPTRGARATIYRASAAVTYHPDDVNRNGFTCS